MKGVAIAMETIIYIILAVTVLTVLLFFFTSQAGPVQNRVELENKRTTLCGQYVNDDFTCTDLSKASSKVVSDLVTACKSLGMCGGEDQIKCIQRCCIVCPNHFS